MARNISDQTGRALEYAIVEEIIGKMPNGMVKLTSAAMEAQERDIDKFTELPDSLRREYINCADKIFTWLNNTFSLLKKDIILHRLSDQDARKGDITDILIKTHTETINLSVKHQHQALKHQRPPSTAQWCGYEKGTVTDRIFRGTYNSILKQFEKDARSLLPGAKYFREIKAKNNKFIENHLYGPVCELVCDFINSKCGTPENTQNLFNFLVGSTDFYKIVVYGEDVYIHKFYDILPPTSVRAELSRSSYVLLEFSNGWKMSMRLHTAASAMGTSLKFDTQPTKLDEVIPVQRL